MTATRHLHDPQALYRQWEGEQWTPWAIDLASDREQWQHRLSEEDKGLIYWALSSLMVAEERITTKFACLVMAAETEEEASYLASQQVDEARHMQFYARFQDPSNGGRSADAGEQRSRDQSGRRSAAAADDRIGVPSASKLAIAMATKRAPGSPGIGTATDDRIRPVASALA